MKPKRLIPDSPPVDGPTNTKKKKRLFPDSKVKRENAIRKRESKNNDLQAAVEYCKQNNVRA